MKTKKLVFAKESSDEEEDVKPELQVPEVSSSTPDKAARSSKAKKAKVAEAGVKEEKEDKPPLGKAKKDKAAKKVTGKLERAPAFLKAPLPHRKKPLVKHPDPASRWFEVMEGVSEVAEEEAELKATKDAAKDFQAHAKRLLAADEALYDSGKGKRKLAGEAEWLGTAAQGGTAADQVAALTLLIQASPVHGLASLAALRERLRKSRHEALACLDTVRDLCLQSLLPGHRKLLPFDRRPLLRVDALSDGDKEARDRRLLLWHFEDRLREEFQELTRELQRLCHDAVAATRLKAVGTVEELLASAPEQEAFLLPTLVNKLGDTDPKVAAKVSSLILKLVRAHPAMSAVVVGEVERVVYRPNIGQRAQFYGVCALSQLILKAADEDLAAQLLRIYLALFQLLVKRSEVENRMLGVLLAGTNRAFPYAKGRLGKLADELDSLYKVAATAALPTALQTLALLYQVLDTDEGGGVSERYYTSLYRLLRSPELLHATGRHSALFNLLYKSLNTDSSAGRVGAFVRRLLELALGGSPSFAAGVLLLLSALHKDRPDLLQLTKEPQAPLRSAVKAAEAEDEEEHYADLPPPDDDAAKEEVEEEPKDPKPKPARPSWLHSRHIAPKSVAVKAEYDAEARNPLYAGAETSMPYELPLLARHYHPSVALFASQLLQGKPLVYQGDPLQDFTLMRFLDRFAFRNPKELAKAAKEGADEAPAKRHFAIRSRKAQYRPQDAKSLALDSAEYARLKKADVPADERFLHAYINAFQPQKKRKSKAEEEEESDVESVASDEAERIIADFEPGDASREAFDVDFASEFGVIRRKGGKKRKAENIEDGEDDEMDSSSGGEEFGELLEAAGAEAEEGGRKSKGLKAYLRRPKAQLAKRQERAAKGRKRRK